MLRVAVPNKGALSQPASAMLTEAGYRQRHAHHELTMVDERNEVEFFFLRPRDIATYVGSGDLDLGITGRDLLLDSGVPVAELLELNFANSKFHFAAPVGAMRGLADLAGKRVATAYPGLVSGYLGERGISATVIRLDGAVETSVRLGVADAIADVVETGTTLRQQGLEIFGDVIVRSQAVLIGRSGSSPEAGARRGQLLRRLQSVLVARQYIMMSYDVPTEQLDAACALTPGIETPTISPLHRQGWVAVQSMVRSAELHGVMDQLHELGARAILVTDIRACRL
ncbi:MAG TPA: ATP phosphoribosyltransferase [Mycobacteriales bacterium]|jgi:ATP phosphoribosyltransferase|nr:ATP phosphoribosyltransferase [Mycobacteriales bacterium]